MGRRKDPVAIVGMACRFPGGASDPEALWSCLARGRDLVGEIDERRWGTEYYYHPDPKAPGRSYTWSAGVLDDIDRFDAAFFGISPREAAEMDPQQRLLLELTWEALEDGAQVPRRLAGSDCAVYIGISSTDYANSRIDDPGSGGAYAMTGGTLSIAANRISYVFDLHGPSMAVDTACSSSLVALHQACLGIWRGESASALAGGVNILMTPFNFIGFSKASMLSPTGRCRAFDAAGDGYVRGEGGAVVFLKPLAQARRDGDPIHALILGSAVNSDGRTRGLSMPNPDAQEALLASAYADAGVDPRELAYVEAHGTGTAAGDPQEARAIGRVLARGRSASDPLPIGSVKTNLGHLEPASGMAGLLKAVLTLRHRAIPASLHFRTPNPDIPFADLNIKVASEHAALPPNGAPAILGVNSFGFGGTNAHVVLKEHRAPAPRPGAGRRQGTMPLFLSARSSAALSDLAGLYRDFLLARGAPPAREIARNAARRRQHHDHRLAVFGRDAVELAGRLEAFATEGRGTGLVSGQAIAQPAKLAFVFSGNGSQWPGMGRRLLAEDPHFRRRVGEVDALVRAASGISVVEELRKGPEESRLHLTEFAQPALFALQAGLLESLDRRGLRPDAVLGHSVGEVAAACAAGVFDLEQAVRVIHARSNAQAPTRGRGRMAALGLSPARAIAAIRPWEGAIELAAVNSPDSVTLSGPLEALEKLGKEWDQGEAHFRILDLDYAFHSRHMDPIRPGLLAALEGLAPSSARVPFISTVSGEAIEGEALGAEYWWDNVRRPVRFEKATATLAGDGVPLFLEIGPRPIMQGYLNENLRAAGGKGRALATLRRDRSGVAHVWEALGAAHAHGARLDFARLFPGRVRALSLPAYPWQKEPYWYRSTNEMLGAQGERPDHPLLGYPVRNAPGEWRSHIDTERLPWLADHVVGGAVVLPAAAFIEMALAASRLRLPAERHAIENLEIRTPVLLESGETKTLRFRLDEDGAFTISSRTRLGDSEWTHHASGTLEGARDGDPAPRYELEGGLSPRARAFGAAEHYRITEALGLRYGPAFRGLAETRCEGDTAWARLRARTELPIEDTGRFHLHPCVLDPCLQMLATMGVAAGRNEEGVGFLPFKVGRLVFHERADDVRHCRAAITRAGPRSLVADFTLLDERGVARVQIEELRFRRMRLTREDEGDPACYAFGTELCTRRDGRAGDYLPRPTDVAEHLVPRITEQWFARNRSDYYDQVLPLFDALAAAFAYRALKELLGSRSRFTLPSLLAASRADAAHAPLLQRLVDMLEEDGAAERDGAQWKLNGAPTLAGAEEIWRLVLADFPACLPEAAAGGRAGLHLPGVLRGECDPADLIAPPKGVATAEHLFEASPILWMSRYALGETLAAIVADWPAGRRLRILEVGAGAMGLSAELLSMLPLERCDYVFTSPNRGLLSRAEAEFDEQRSFATMEIDFGRDPRDQRLAPSGFDVVIAPWSLHAMADLGTALEVIRWLLAQDGLLLMVERAPDRMNDLIFGLQPEWWARSLAPPAPPRGRLLGEHEWCSLLERRGFADTVPLSEPVASADASSFLIVARNPEYDEVAMDTSLAEPETWLVLADAAPVSSHIVEELRSGGRRVIVAGAGDRFRRREEEAFELDPTCPGHFERLFSVLDEEEVRIAEVVHMMGLVLEDGPAALDVETARARTLCALHAARCLARREAPPRLWLVAGGALPIESRTLPPRHSPSQSALAGFGRVLANEHPELRCRTIDLRCEDPSTAARLLAAELHDPDDEDEVLVSARARHAPRLECLRPGADAAQAPRRLPERGRVLRLDFAVPGPLSHLIWREEARRRPGRGEIEIRVRATGLNFRDVMYAMGILPDEAVENGFAGATLGMECAGDVVAVGPDITGFRIGDPVVCFAPACFATFVTTGTSAVAHRPQGWTHDDAATIPSVFFTAYYALHHLAGLSRGDKVLIHGAAGGVGMAAIQYARYVGAEIFATAGSPRKRDFLRLLGVEHVLDSRRLLFGEEIMRITGGEGVDVVLNSLSGAAMRHSLRVLKPFGRFLELGKRDFYEDAKVGLRPFRNNISYHGIDADQLLADRSDLATTLFRAMMRLFEQGAFRPLVHRTFPARRITEAFRCMQQSAHIGKIVVTYEDAERIEPAGGTRTTPAPLALDGEGTYLVTGGLGGFGLATAAWLAEKGAGKLVLAGRTGASTSEAREGLEALRSGGTEVEVCEADVCDRGALAQVMETIDRGGRPLRGIVHAAMVLDDALVIDQNVESFNRSFDPKALGAFNLHELTRTRTLDFFVLLSSVTTSIGNPGQSNYVAGNLYLESLALHRLTHGLPALAVAFGPIGDAGYLARNERLRDTLEARTGGAALSAKQALDKLETLMREGRSGVAVANLDWRVLHRTLAAVRTSRFSRLDPAAEEAGKAGDDIQELLAGLSETEVHETVTGLLTEQVAKVLRLPVERVERNASIYDLGMDSLMAVELHMAVEEHFHVHVPVMAVTEGASIAALAGRIARQLGSRGSAAAGASAARSQMVEGLAARHGESLGDDEIEAFLAGMEARR